MTNDMNRIHYCNNKTLKVKDIAQHFQITSKPLGLWYEIDGAWLKWVESEMPEWKHQRYTGAFKIEVDLSKMLVLRTNRRYIVLRRNTVKHGLVPISKVSIGQKLLKSIVV